MIPAAIMRSLTTPALEAKAFRPTKWSSAEDKAWFGNHLLKFLAMDFPRPSFSKRLYGRLSNTFGHIAHYNIHIFFDDFFLTQSSKIEFLTQSIAWPCWGDGEYTYCDVEHAVIHRVRGSGLLQILQAQLNEETRQSELAALTRLKAKYEPTLQIEAPALRQSSLFDFSAE
jgi:hypothetical protein